MGQTAEPCVPLATARVEAEAIWRRLDERADLLGLAPRAAAAASEHDPALRVVLDDGSLVPALWQDGRRYFFRLPAGRRAARLRSRATTPARAVGAYVDDRRRLGVQIEALIMWHGLEERRIAAERLEGSGWHALEGVVRWTDGDAVLDVPMMVGDGFIEFVVTDSLAYPVEPTEPARLAA